MFEPNDIYRVEYTAFGIHQTATFGVAFKVEQFADAIAELDHFEDVEAYRTADEELVYEPGTGGDDAE